MKSVGYLRTELVLNLHSGRSVFPSTSSTSLPVTSSMLGDWSVCPTLSTRLSESDLGSNQRLFSSAMMTRQMGINEGWFLLIDWYKSRCSIGILLPLCVLFVVHLRAWFGFGSDPPQSQSVQTRFWEDKLAIKYKQHPSGHLAISLSL